MQYTVAAELETASPHQFECIAIGSLSCCSSTAWGRVALAPHRSGDSFFLCVKERLNDATFGLRRFINLLSPIPSPRPVGSRLGWMRLRAVALPAQPAPPQ